MDPRGIATETVNVGGATSWHDAPRREMNSRTLNDAAKGRKCWNCKTPTTAERRSTILDDLLPFRIS